MTKVFARTFGMGPAVFPRRLRDDLGGEEPRALPYLLTAGILFRPDSRGVSGRLAKGSRKKLL